MKILLTFILSGLAYLGVFGQADGGVRGCVKDEDEKEGLALASVLLYPYGRTDEAMVAGSSADFDGNFHISAVPPGRYTLQASFVGYAMVEQEVWVKAGQVTTLDVVLSVPLMTEFSVEGRTGHRGSEPCGCVVVEADRQLLCATPPCRVKRFKRRLVKASPIIFAASLVGAFYTNKSVEQRERD